MKKIFEQFFNMEVLENIPDVKYFIDEMLKNINEEHFEKNIAEMLKSAEQNEFNKMFILDSKNKNMVIGLKFLNYKNYYVNDKNRLKIANCFTFVYCAKKKVEISSISNNVFIKFYDLKKDESCNRTLLTYKLTEKGNIIENKVESDIDYDISLINQSVEEETEKVFGLKGEVC